MSEDPLKIFTVSLASPKKYQAFAVYNGEQLLITNVTAISGILSRWKAPLIAEIKEKKSQGFAVIVEELGEIVSDHASQYLFEEMNENGRSNYYDALDWYFHLQNMDCLIFHPDCQKHALKAESEGSMIEKRQDEKGRIFYGIDWQRFTGAHRAVLLCVVAAMTEPLSDRYIEAMFGKPIPEPDDENPVRRWTKLVAARDLSKGKRLEEEREKKA